MASTTYQFAKAVALTDYQPAFRSKQDEQLWAHDKVCTEKSTGRATEQVFSFAGLPAANQTGELEPIFYTDMAELGNTTFTVNKFTLATMMSHELIKDNIHLPDIMKEAGTAARESHRFIKAQAIAAIFNRAFDSSYPMYDGVELCGSHTMNDGTTYDNDLTPASLTFDNLWLAINHYETSLVSHAGLYLRDKPECLVYHPSKEKEVQALLKTQLEPGTADNDKNTIRDYNLKPVPCRFLSTSTNWFLTGSKFKKDLQFWSREKPSFDTDDDFDRMAMKLRSFQRFAVGVREFLYCVGNPGV